jgi:hypothetical protein
VFIFLTAFRSHIRLKDRTRIKRAMKTAVKIVEDKFGRDSHSEVILITDAPSYAFSGSSYLEYPLNMRVHIILLRSKTEEDDECEDEKELSRKTFGVLQTIELPHNAHLFKHQLMNSIYSTYSGHIAFGHLKAQVTLHPNPNISLARTLATEKGTSVAMTFSNSTIVELPPSFPTTLSILGFVPLKKLPSPPILCRHIVVPSTSNSSSQEFCVLLNDSLKNERMAAIALLAQDWYAIFNSIAERDKSGIYSCSCSSESLTHGQHW